jgi:ABC-type transport system involved in multi-copper enzyme maturation permease subunit
MAWNVFLHLKFYFQNPYLWGSLAVAPLFYFFYLWIIRKSTQADIEGQGAGPGCLVQILGLFLQAVMISSLILLLLPILLGVARQVSWQAVEPLGFVAIRSGLLAMILVTVLSFFPGVGKILGSSPGLETLLMSCLTFRFLAPLYLETLLGKGAPLKNYFPPWWIVLILCVFSWLISRLLMLLIFTVVKHREPSKSVPWRATVGPSLDILSGILPFLYYAAWVAYSLKGVG